MTNPIGRRLDRLETEVQKRTDPGYGPVFKFINDPRDPENAKRFLRPTQQRDRGFSFLKAKAVTI